MYLAETDIPTSVDDFGCVLFKAPPYFTTVR